MVQKTKKNSVEITEVGNIIDIKKDVITVSGIPNCVFGELLDFESGDKGLVIEFDEKRIVALLMGSGINAKAGDKAVSRGDLFRVPVTDKLVGRIVNALVKPMDGKGPIKPSAYNPVFKDAPAIMSRVPITESLETGIKILDTMIAVGKGQRELIIGDRQTGKTTIAMDAVINQKGKDVVCIYCWIGGSYTSMVKIIEALNGKGAMDHTIIVAAPASASSTEQYLAPYTASAIGEHFIEQKKDVLVVFDNLTRHAWIYRQIALLLNRSPGREAYPGDIFYVHSQLMERACRMNPKIGGSMTFLPIADTLQGDITGYVQTNLVSMTDGQIYTSAVLFNEGFRPAVDIGLSVSRIGSKVQSAALKEVSVQLRLEYAQFKELQKLTKMRAKISSEIAKKISRGQTLTEILIQPANAPISEMEEILIFYAFDVGVLDPFGREEIVKFEKNILKFMKEKHSEILGEIKITKELTPEIKQSINKAFMEFFKEHELLI